MILTYLQLTKCEANFVRLSKIVARVGSDLLRLTFYNYLHRQSPPKKLPKFLSANRRRLHGFASSFKLISRRYGVFCSTCHCTQHCLKEVLFFCQYLISWISQWVKWHCILSHILLRSLQKPWFYGYFRWDMMYPDDDETRADLQKLDAALVFWFLRYICHLKVRGQISNLILKLFQLQGWVFTEGSS